MTAASQARVSRAEGTCTGKALSWSRVMLGPQNLGYVHTLGRATSVGCYEELFLGDADLGLC